MDWFIHDRSLNGQYPDSTAFLDSVKELLRLRGEIPAIRDRLRCSRAIGDLPATPTHSFRQLVQASGDRNLRQLVLQWIESKGPFLDEDSEAVGENYFEYGALDVTNEGTGEAARRILNGLEAMTFSFSGGGSDHSPLRIEQGLPEDRIACVEVPNVWTIADLRASALAALPAVVNWKQTIARAQFRFPKLLLADNLIDYLRRETFTAHLADSIFTRLAKLQELIDSRKPDGSNSAETDRLIATHFAGEKAWFTDESVTNKAKFRQTLTFADPANPTARIFCPFHGKIKTPQYRIHFPWPLAQEDSRLRIAYIGPKLTKN
jgi:hypothetical protein